MEDLNHISITKDEAKVIEIVLKNQPLISMLKDVAYNGGNPKALISLLGKVSSPVSYADLVNDNDAISQLKYTYKGISDLGEDGTSDNTSIAN
jgi:hypothetical protein